KCGYMIFTTREEDVPVFKRNIALQNKLGVMSEWLDGDEVRRRLPMMNLNDVIGATYHKIDGLADPNSVVMAYIGAGSRLGVTALTGVEVTRIEIEHDQVTGVHTSAGMVSAPIVVNAAGPWAGVIGEMAGIRIPITPVRRQMLTTTPLPDIPKGFPFVIDFPQSLYFHREGEGLLTGRSNPDELPGFDQNVDPDWELTAMESAIARLPLLEKAGLASHWAGLYEVTPDAHPIFGRTPVEGFYLVGGFSGHGFMHGPVSGVLMSEIILDGTAKTVDVSMLDLARFEEGRLVREYNVI
ncbi:MAG TPA: FAD-dependent oxidoreductase, partial [Anaerolineales bacterium]|nr:FAD-dependent oxidoreductase [Anaerolineales bacterium]